MHQHDTCASSPSFPWSVPELAAMSQAPLSPLLLHNRAQGCYASFSRGSRTVPAHLWAAKLTGSSDGARGSHFILLPISTRYEHSLQDATCRHRQETTCRLVKASPSHKAQGYVGGPQQKNCWASLQSHRQVTNHVTLSWLGP